jgi:predicted dehydrogenase
MQSAYFSLDYQEQSLRGASLTGDGPSRSIQPLSIEIEKAEPLRAELEHFLAACRGLEVPLVDGAAGRRALETALEVVKAIG